MYNACPKRQVAKTPHATKPGPTWAQITANMVPQNGSPNKLDDSNMDMAPGYQYMWRETLPPLVDGPGTTDNAFSAPVSADANVSTTDAHETPETTNRSRTPVKWADDILEPEQTLQVGDATSVDTMQQEKLWPSLPSIDMGTYDSIDRPVTAPKQGECAPNTRDVSNQTSVTFNSTVSTGTGGNGLTCKKKPRLDKGGDGMQERTRNKSRPNVKTKKQY
jgi:hypothetical protein